MKGLIVGIDPGNVTAISILDKNGNLISLISKRNFGIDQIINFLKSFPKPIIISTDVNPAPKLVEKVANSLDTFLFTPKSSISIKEKRKLIKKFEELIKNEHEADSLASSFFALKKFKDLFEKVERLTFNLNERAFDFIVDLILKKKCNNLSEALSIYQIKIEEEKKIKEKEIVEIKKMEEKIKSLEKEKEDILKKFNHIKKRFNNLSKRFQDLKMKKIGKILKKNLLIYRKFKFFKEFSDLLIQDKIPIIFLQKIDKSYLEKLDNQISLKNKIIFTNDINNLKLLENYNLKCVLTSLDFNFFSKLIVKKVDLSLIKRFKNFYYIERNDLEKVLAKR